MKMARKLIPRSSRCNYSSFTHGRRTERRDCYQRTTSRTRPVSFQRTTPAENTFEGTTFRVLQSCILLMFYFFFLCLVLRKVGQRNRSKRKRTEYSSLTTTTATTAATTYDTQTEEISRRQQTEWSNW